MLLVSDGYKNQNWARLILSWGQLAKTMNQGHPAEVSQVGSLEEKSNVSGSFGHGTQTSHLVRFLSQEFYRAYYTLFSSENTN